MKKCFTSAPRFSCLPDEGLRKWQNKSPGRDEGGNKTETTDSVEYLATLARNPDIFFSLPFLGFACVSGNVSHVSTLSCPFHRALCGFLAWGYGTRVWDGPGPVFTSGWPGSRQSCGAEVNHLSRGSLIPSGLN